MAEFDDTEDFAAEHTLTMGTRTSTDSGNGDAVDLRGWEAATVLIETGTLAAGAEVSFTLEVSRDGGSTWEAADSTYLIDDPLPTAAAADNDGDDVYAVGYVEDARHVRVNFDASSGSGDATFSVLVLKGEPAEAGFTP